MTAAAQRQLLDRTGGGRDRRHRGGYTMAEIAIVSILSATLILIALRWIGGVANVAIADLTDTQTQRARTAVLLIEEDLRRAQHCDQNGLDHPLVALASNGFTVLADDQGDGDVDKVVWRYRQGYLERAVVADSGSCSFAAPTDNAFTRVLGSLDAATFRGVADGAVDTTGTLNGTCAANGDSTCSVAAIDVAIISTSGSLTAGVYPVGG